MAREVLSNGVINPDKYQADWYADLSNNWNLLNNLIGSAISSSEVDSKIATAIQELMIRTFQIVAELPATGTEGVMYLVLIPNTSKYTAYVWENNAYRELGTVAMTITVDDALSTTSENPVQNKVITDALNNKAPTSHTHNASDITSGLATVATSGSYNDLSNKPTIPTVNDATLTIQKNGSNVATFTANASSDVTCNITIPTTLESLASNSIPFHNAYPRCKYLGTTITDAQNTAIKNRTYDDLFIGDYWTINGVNWRIVAIDYYYNVGDTNFDKGNIIVMPDTVLYDTQMNTTSTTAGAYAGSLMRAQNLNNARTIAQNAFGSHLANHRIVLANAVDASGPSNWSWYDSDGVELPNEVQIYGTRVWGSALKGFDVATQKYQFPLLVLAPQFVNTRQSYWLQDVSSNSVSSHFAHVYLHGKADRSNASSSYGVRPSVTLSYI